jgi:hypothetical protein
MLEVIFALSILQQIGFTVAYLPQLKSLVLHGDRDASISLVYYYIRIISLIMLSVVYYLQQDVLLFYCNFTGVAAEVAIVILVLRSRIYGLDFNKYRSRTKDFWDRDCGVSESDSSGY